MTQIQKDFLLEYFFKNESYAGWKNIAVKLLDYGKCIVAGNNCIWVGGIGNFIKTNHADDLVNCLEYTFDLEYFLSSEWYKQISNEYIAILSQKKNDIIAKYNDICNL